MSGAAADLTWDGINDAVDEWHDAPAAGQTTLSEHLGMTREQYAFWVQGIACRRCHGVAGDACDVCGRRGPATPVVEMARLSSPVDADGAPVRDSSD